MQRATRSLACDDIASAAKIPNIADRPESALHRFGTALGSLIKAPPINRGLLTPLITGAAGSQRSTNSAAGRSESLSSGWRGKERLRTQSIYSVLAQRCGRGGCGTWWRRRDDGPRGRLGDLRGHRRPPASREARGCGRVGFRAQASQDSPATALTPRNTLLDPTHGAGKR